MGVTIREKPKGSGVWWIFVTHNGRRRSKKIGKDKRLAREVAKRVEAKLALGDLGIFKEDKGPCFREYATEWMNITVAATCKASTISDYKGLLKNHILPIFGDKPIKTITRGMIKDFLQTKVNEGYRPSTVTHMKNVISGVLNRAVDNDIIQSNPALRLGKIAKNTDRRRVVNPLTADELNVLLDTFGQWFPKHYALVLTLARTGMRIGEAIALRWGDIDFKGRFIDVKRGFARGKLETPKSGKMRRVDMSKHLTETLARHKVESKKKGLALGLGGLPEFVFTNEVGKPLDINHWRKRVFNKALEKAGLRHIRIHDLRHTYATLRIGKGDNIQDVSNQLGRHSVKLTLDTYSHWMPGKKKNEVDALDELGDLHLSAPYLRPNKKSSVPDQAK